MPESNQGESGKMIRSNGRSDSSSPVSAGEERQVDQNPISLYGKFHRRKVLVAGVALAFLAFVKFWKELIESLRTIIPVITSTTDWFKNKLGMVPTDVQRKLQSRFEILKVALEKRQYENLENEFVSLDRDFKEHQLAVATVLKDEANQKVMDYLMNCTNQEVHTFLSKLEVVKR